MERYILECSTVDSLGRPRGKTIVGVFETLDKLTEHMQTSMQADDLIKRWDVSHMVDPAHLWVKNGA
jgi:hypothetical protein